jgi:hypothetical protein
MNTMRRTLISVAAIFCSILVFISCNSTKDDEVACDNKGSVCFNNKTDSAVVITIKEAPDQFTLAKDNIKCVSLVASKHYTINISGKEHESDSSIVVQPCDKIDYLILH